MARKPATRAEFVLFDVFHADGSQRSNRRVPSEILGGVDGDAPARAVIQEQNRLIAENGLQPAGAIARAARGNRPGPALDEPRQACRGARSARVNLWPLQRRLRYARSQGGKGFARPAAINHGS